MLSLSRTVPTAQQLLIGRKTAVDIELYLQRKIGCLKRDGLLPQSASTGSLVEHLLTGADGMFLWARLMISYLKCPSLSRAQRVEVIENVILPEGLETMYQRIGYLIGQGYQIQQTLAKTIILFLAITERNLTIQELQCAITTIAAPNNSSDETNDLVEFKEMVAATCADLVETESLYSPVHERIAEFF